MFILKGKLSKYNIYQHLTTKSSKICFLNCFRQILELKLMKNKLKNIYIMFSLMNYRRVFLLILYK